MPVLSMINNTVLDYIYDAHSHRITQWNHSILDPVNLERYANAIPDKGAALDNCIGFIDGTVRPICRPGEMQKKKSTMDISGSTQSNFSLSLCPMG